MPKPNGHPMFFALPPYFGGKRQLLPLIFARLAEICPVSCWSNLRFIDVFTGGGSVSLHAKAMGFGELHCNDWSPLSQLILQGLLANARVKLSREDTLSLMTYATSPSHFIQSEFGGSVFSQRHAKALDQAMGYIETVADTTKQALLRLLMWHLLGQYVAFGTSIGASNKPFAEVLDGKRNWWELNPKRLRDGSFSKLFMPVWAQVEKKRQAINGGVFAATGPVIAYRQDAFRFIRDAEGDIAYFDPPYPGTLSYEKANRVLETVLLGGYSRAPQIVSPFTRSIQALAELLLAARHIPFWLISLNNKVVDLDTLKILLRKVDPTREVTGYAQSYSHLAHVSRQTSNQELLIRAVNPAILNTNTHSLTQRRTVP